MVCSCEPYTGSMSGDTLFRGPSDLHTHSRVSDGTESPSRLVREAAAAGLGTVALTDHDSTAGWHEAGAEARKQNITFIPGMEFSTRFGYKSVHLLAYLFDPLSADLVAETARIRESRLKRAESIVRRIGVDYALDWDDVLAQTTPGATAVDSSAAIASAVAAERQRRAWRVVRAEPVRVLFMAGLLGDLAGGFVGEGACDHAPGSGFGRECGEVEGARRGCGERLARGIQGHDLR